MRPRHARRRAGHPVIVQDGGGCKRLAPRQLRAQVDFGLTASMLIGTRMTPRFCAALVQLAMRSIEAGSAEAVPMALPRSRAIASRRASAASIAAWVGAASSTTSALAKGTLVAPAIWFATLRADEPSSK